MVLSLESKMSINSRSLVCNSPNILSQDSEKQQLQSTVVRNGYSCALRVGVRRRQLWGSSVEYTVKGKKVSSFENVLFLSALKRQSNMSVIYLDNKRRKKTTQKMQGSLQLFK